MSDAQGQITDIGPPGDLASVLRIAGHLEGRALNKAESEELFRRFERFGPEPKGELDFINPYTLLVAVVLSAQATDATSTRRPSRCSRSPTRPQKMLALGEDAPQGARSRPSACSTPRPGTSSPCRASSSSSIGGAGAARARGAGGAARRRPQDGERRAQHRLRRAHHRGRHASSSGSPTAPGSRPAGRRSRSRRASTQGHPTSYRRHAHHWLILHGRYVCKARKPDCPACIIRDLCPFKAKTLAEGEAAVSSPARASGAGPRSAAGRRRA